MLFGQVLRQRRELLGLTQDVLAAMAMISKPYLSNLETGRAKNPPADEVLIKLETALRFEPGHLVWLGHLARTPADVRSEHEALVLKLGKFTNVLKGLLASRQTGVWPELDALAEDPELQETLASGTSFRRGGATIPVVNTIAEGYPRMPDLNYPPGQAQDYIRCPDVEDSQAFAVRVVGDLMEPRYRQGELVVFSPGAIPTNGDDCFVRFQGEKSSTFQRIYLDTEDMIRLQPLNNRYPASTYNRERITGLWPATMHIERLRR